MKGWLRRWWYRRQMGRLLGDQMVWVEEVLNGFAAHDPERALRAKYRLQAILNADDDPNDPLMKPRIITEYLMSELRAAIEEGGESVG